ncbi:hypothetical protein ME1_00965 [Bartonella vinsonii subsp. arupensis OK-94-513]|uniref:UDP-3-O-[3-hydroxymyristoyl] glucosamine N-acyltransferase n=1 Tax=Bartonella vinsonii subsp. arupensis OK-94-513 TaxID=1094562 RepID=J0QQH6_BARVI|nr:hypothetical protein [Bartonella vinsonii]EJF88001.1 hypothetical protein ME1_00965 [Bartonella vinsonii subsp. arupensis OK-94-513]
MNATVNKKTSSKKYEFTCDMQCVDGHLLYRIRALKDFADVKKGDLGGYIEKQSNLSHKGDCWVYDHARVFQNARVFGNAKVKGYFVDVYGNAHVSNAVVIEGNAKIYDNACVTNYAHISDDSVICGDAHVGGNAKISDGAYICDESRVFDDAVICGALVSGDSYIHSAASLTEDDQIDSEAIPRFGSKDDYYRHEYYDDYGYDDDCDYNSEDANQAA